MRFVLLHQVDVEYDIMIQKSLCEIFKLDFYEATPFGNSKFSEMVRKIFIGIFIIYFWIFEIVELARVHYLRN